MVVLPAAAVGFAGLTDGIGPQGWRGLAELFGWFITCLVASGLLAFLLGRGRRVGAPAYALALAAVAGLGLLAYGLLDWLGLGAPMSAKTLFTSLMQAVGVIGPAVSLLLLVNAFRTVGRRR